jgi:homoserine kinase
MFIRVPASSANLGPGFDVLGMALEIYCDVGEVSDGPAAPGARIVDRHHPASVAFARAGGLGELWIRNAIPEGRGLGFSGAARVGGALAGAWQRNPWPTAGAMPRAELDRALAVATELEGHADNAAASARGGVVAVAAGHVVPIPLGFEPAVLVWIPPKATSTDSSRRKLPTTVPFDDAVFNVGRVALLVAACVSGDIAALRRATEDRLHQDQRLATAPRSRRAIEAALAAGAWCAWLSGSGPTVAALCDPASVRTIASHLPTDGTVRSTVIDRAGARVVDGVE